MAETFHASSEELKKMEEGFEHSAFTNGMFDTDGISFAGKRSVIISSILPGNLQHYDRSKKVGTGSRYGETEEVGDTQQVMEMKEEYSMSLSIDKGNNTDKFNMPQAGKVMAVNKDEVIIPELDRFRLRTWADNAGIHYELGSDLTAENIIQTIMDARTMMKNRRVKNGARLTIDLTYIPTIVDSKYFTSIEKIGEKAVVEGSIGKIFGMDVFECESDLMPANVPFMITVKKALLAPKKINDFKIHTDPPGLSGNLLEFRMYHDAFVRGKKSDGALAACAKGTVVKAPTITMNAAAATIASATSGATVYYTLDGSDPRYSTDAKAYTAAVTLAKGDKLRAYAKKDGMFNSDVAAKDYTG